MDQFGEDPLTKLAFTIQANKGVYALLLGSGISRSSGIMTGWEITCDLVARYAAAQGIEDHFLEWYKKTYSQEEPNYSEIIGALGKTQQERQSIIEKYIEPSLEDLQQGLRIPTEAHKAIAKLVKDGFIKVVITTNFDRLLEKALSADEIGITPTVISSEEDLIQGQKPLEHSNCYIIKVHGDYKDAKIKNTKEELSKYSDEYNAILKRIFNNYGLIVCGWSAEYDTALIKAIRSATNRRYSLFWTSYNELKTNEEAKLLIDDREGIPIITNKIGGADGFFTKLQEKVEQIEKLSLRRPRTEALILSTLKDYLSEPEKNRIKIDDLFKEVLTTQLLEFPEFHKDSWVHRSWEEKFTICENQTQTLAKMVGILGIYGKNGDKEVKFVCQMIQDIFDELRNKTERARYLVVDQNYNKFSKDQTNFSYPAYLLFKIYSTALVQAERWRELYQLLSFYLERIYYDDQTARKISINWLFARKAFEHQHRLKKDQWNTINFEDHFFNIIKNWNIQKLGPSSDIALNIKIVEILQILVDIKLQCKHYRQCGFITEENDDLAVQAILEQDNNYRITDYFGSGPFTHAKTKLSWQKYPLEDNAREMNIRLKELFLNDMNFKEKLSQASFDLVNHEILMNKFFQSI